ncbi:MAG: molybdopterin-dependent oxidoreductase [Luteimonas sp.]
MIRITLALSVLSLSACVSTGPTTTPPPAAAVSSPLTPTDVSDHDPRLRAGSRARAALPSPVIVPLDATTLAALPRDAVTATAHGVTRHCEGVSLAALLRAAGAMPDEPLKGAQLTRYVQVDARDGYRALFALSELDPTLGNHPVTLADRCDGKPLAADDGPLRLIVPNEARPARWVRQVKSIVVIVAP